MNPSITQHFEARESFNPRVYVRRKRRLLRKFGRAGRGRVGDPM